MDDATTTGNLYSLPSNGKADSLGRAKWITNRAWILFSAYRRDDYADPKGFLAQLNIVLEGYSDPIVTDVTDPKTGLQRRSKFPPTIAEVVEACDAEKMRVEKIGRFKAMGEVRRSAREPQNKGNVFVPPEAPQYARMIAKTREPGVEDYWRTDPDRAGIWVPLGWLTEAQTAKPDTARRMTAAELEAIYRRNEGARAADFT